MARATVAWAGREVGGISLARSAKYFVRDTLSMTRGVEKLSERMGIDPLLHQAGEELDERFRSRNAIPQD
jgi:hypothetical protein